MKRKWMAILAAFLCVGGSMTACGGDGTLQTDALDGVTRIEVQSGSTGQYVSVNDADTLQTLTGYFTEHVFLQEGACDREAAWSYRLQCYDREGHLIDVLEVMAADQVCHDGTLYAVEAQDAIDLAYLQGMLTGKPIEVSMSIKPGTLAPTGATLVLANPSEDEFTYGSMYRLEQKEDGVWKHAETLLENYMFHLLAYSLGARQTVEESVDWEWLYGALRPGEYRILKGVSITSGRFSPSYAHYYLFVEFEID